MSTTVILISGANTGIGYEIAKKLLTDHSNLHLFVGSRSVDNGTKAVQELKTFSQSSNRIEVIQLDINDDSSIVTCVSTIKSKAGHLDVLINNAGIAPMAEDTSPASLRKVFNDTYNTNVTSTAVLTEACVELLSAASVPRLIFITSGLSSLSRVSGISYAQATTKQYQPYVVSKCGMVSPFQTVFALDGFTTPKLLLIRFRYPLLNTVGSSSYAF